LGKTLNMRLFFLSAIALIASIGRAQKVTETPPPYNIKTISFLQNGQVASPFFEFGSPFQIEFDDLFGNEANYYYEIVHCNYDWTPSELSENEFVQGFASQRIQEYTNSFNTLQMYSHYVLSFPNKFTRFLVSGNYLIRVLNESREVVFSRKFILYEDLVSVPLQVRRARNLSMIDYKQDLDFSIKSNNIIFQNPLKNVKVLLMQNGRLDNAIANVKPQYTIGNELIYKYDVETQFWGGNEFRYFENKDIRAAASNVMYVDSNSDGGTYNSHLYPAEARGQQPYTYAPDINGRFLVKNIGATNNDVEADYAWVYFTLSAPSLYGKKNVYINGMFNNYALGDENRMDYNESKGIYEKAIMIKQGFTNYQFVVADPDGTTDPAHAVDGNFYQTENDYFVLVYYREGNARYDRAIGRGVANSQDIIN
jgi:hypothetical protein